MRTSMTKDLASFIEVLQSQLRDTLAIHVEELIGT